MILDSGQRREYDNGFVRDLNTGKLRRDLIPVEMMERTCRQYTDGMVKYGADNWKLARGSEAINRFKESAYRHFFQRVKGDVDEDHGCGGVVFNIYAYEFHKKRMLENDLVFDDNGDEQPRQSI